MPRKDKDQLFNAVDIFSGAGGLTTGLKSAGFRVIAGVELEPHAVATYKVNHPETKIFKQDVTTVKGVDLLAEANSNQIHLLAGCPPCQGFTTLTAKYKKTDPRNRLIREVARLIEESKPLSIMIENVPGLAKKGQRLFNEFIRRIEAEGYIADWGVLQVADFGIPQSRRRLVLLAGRGFSIPLPKPTHSKSGEDGLQKWRSIRSVLVGLTAPTTLAEASASGGTTHDWNVVRTLSEKNIQRLQYAVPGKSRKSIPKRLRPKCHKNRDTGFSNVYGRMKWDDVSPTITAGCTTLSKGRFGHPEEDRTVSVREAALLQTFPKEYIFSSPYMAHVCEMIGNALPCEFAAILAQACADSIRKNLRLRSARSARRKVPASGR